MGGGVGGGAAGGMWHLPREVGHVLGLGDDLDGQLLCAYKGGWEGGREGERGGKPEGGRAGTGGSAEQGRGRREADGRVQGGVRGWLACLVGWSEPEAMIVACGLSLRTEGMEV